MGSCHVGRVPCPFPSPSRAWQVRIFAFLLTLLAVGLANAQARVPTILVVETGDGVDGDALRAAISRELGVVAVPPSNPRGANRSGTVRVRIDPAKGELAVEYEERPRVITRTVPIPVNPDAVMKSAVFLAGNLARNEAADLTWAMRLSAPPTAETSSPPKPERLAKRFWFGASVEMDGLSMPADDNRNVCLDFVAPTGYYCTNEDGSNFDGFSGTNSVEGGFEIKNGRFVASADYALTDNWMVGARIGFIAQRYPGSYAPHQKLTLGRLHTELRALYAFGDHALAEGVAPYAIFAAGMAQFDAKSNLLDPQEPVRQAWKVYGPFFSSFGFGLRWAMTPDVAVMATPARITLVFPYETTWVWSPEAGVQVGF